MGISLYHYSEEPDITEFVPRPATSYPELGSVVWALDGDFEPLYLFPRDCPRVAYWALPETTPEDIEKFFGQTAATLVQSIESAWLERLRATTIYRYKLPSAQFERDASPGYYGAHLARETVRPLSVEPIPDLLAAHAAGSELRITPSLWPLHDALLNATLHFSMIRMRNAQVRQQ